MKKTILLLILVLPLFMSARNEKDDRNRGDKTGMHIGLNHGVPVININNTTVTEELGTVTLTILLSGLADKPVTVRYKTEDGTARHHQDYKKAKGFVVIPAGSLSANITLQIIKDNRIEPTEYFRVTLQLGRNERDATLEDATGRVTIVNGETSHFELNNLVVVYRNTNGGTIDDTSLLAPALKEARDFYWRHSHMALDIKWTIYVIDDYLDRVHENGYVYPHEVDADLVSRGFTAFSYDAVVAVVRGGGSYAWGVNNVLLATACYFQVPWWDEHYLFSWYFVHEFHHIVDAMFAFSGHPDYPHNHPSEARRLGEYVPHSGSNWDLNSEILQFWGRQHWPDLTRGAWGTIKFSIDNDLDTIPDKDPDVPLDEVRFGSSRLKKDSDHDGLSDLQEAIAGIFEKTDPRDDDTDRDGLRDGEDTEPVYPMKTIVPERSGVTLEQDITEWPLSGHYFFNRPDGASSSLFLTYTKNAYTRNNFYVGFSIPFEMTSCRIVIDANNDGIFYGSDNIEVIMNGNTIEAVNLYDAASSPPDDIISALPTTGFSGALKSSPGWSSYQLIIPQLPEYGLSLAAGEEIGIYIEIAGYGNGTMLEPDDFISVILGEETEPGEKMPAIKAVTTSKEANPVLTKLTAAAYPNPSAQSFTLQWRGNDQPVRMTITDATGRLIETRTGVKTNAIQTGTNWKPGVYYAEFMQGNEKVVMKLVKQ